MANPIISGPAGVNIRGKFRKFTALGWNCAHTGELKSPTMNRIKDNREILITLPYHSVPEDARLSNSRLTRCI